jgi:hypothetical protein
MKSTNYGAPYYIISLPYSCYIFFLESRCLSQHFVLKYTQCLIIIITTIINSIIIIIAAEWLHKFAQN